ncbi:MAG: hypothetical protein ACXAD7_13735 [Candidatus Kariarchaeaceae archaeon]|jgi:cell division GTPase FtsZ
MARKKSLFSFLKKKTIGSESILFSELEYLDASDKQEKLDDFSKIDLQTGDITSPKLIATISRSPQIPIIGVGGCGVRIASSIAARLKEYDTEYPVLGIETDEDELATIDLSHKFLIPGTSTGTAKQFRKGATLVESCNEELSGSIEDYLSSLEQIYKHEIVFLIMGSGGTGVGAGIEIAKRLIDIGKRPVPFLILPGKDENTRIKFNAASALYRFMYAPADRCLKLTTICIDNEYFFNKNTKNSYATVIAAINERVGAVIGDLLVSSEIDSDGYSADLNEFLEIFREIKGLGTLTYMHSGSEYETITSFFEAKQSISHSIDVNVLSSTRSYCFIQATKDTISSQDYRSLLTKFSNSDIFPKFVEVEDETTNYEIRGIFTGIKLPQILEDYMQMAEDARVSILNIEIQNAKEGKVNPKLDRLKGDEEIDVKTGEELSKERSEEYAEKRRRGDLT